jgi:hypothetical protein
VYSEDVGSVHFFIRMAPVITKKPVLMAVMSLLVVLAIAPLYNAEPNIATEAPKLEAVMVSAAPTLDGVADEAFWKDAVAVKLELRRGVNFGEPTFEMKSVYTQDRVYFLAT